MAANAQKRLIRKLDLELFLATLKTQPNPEVRLEQYTTSEQVAANMLYIAAYQNGDIIKKKVLDLGCGTGRLGLGAVFLGAAEVVGIDIHMSAIKVAIENSINSGLTDGVHWINGDISAITGKFDTVLQNPPFGIQRREADRPFMVKALEVGSSVYSLHSHPEVDERLIKKLKANHGVLQVHSSTFLERLIENNNGSIKAVYAMLMTIPHMFDFHKKMKYDFVIDLYVIKKQGQ
jgi:putative methylase